MHSIPVFGALRKEFTAALENTHKVKLQIKLGRGWLLFQMNYGPLPDEQMWIKKMKSHGTRNRVFQEEVKICVLTMRAFGAGGTDKGSFLHYSFISGFALVTKQWRIG